ncbi:hypothetical protein [Roseiterribacter gracilis]|uniref:DUF2254 domain-containing protein n=1 Tax=Roseiterribacter gracilis TaxID=2812848 RepID=A0A8S8X5T4_9PROT|nr:hypothetical protein TMPK1_03350 [Rhodospirillales bacterium TMPK1]
MPNARFACLAAAALAGAVALLATVSEFANTASARGAWLRTGWPEPASSLLVAVAVGFAAAALVATVALSGVAVAELTRLVRKLEVLSLSDEPVRARLQQYFAATVLAKDGDALLKNTSPDPDLSIDRALATRSFRSLSLLLLGAGVVLALYRLAFADASSADIARLLLPPVAAALCVATTLLVARWMLLPLAQDALAAGAAALTWTNSERAIVGAEDDPAPLTEAIELLRGDLHRWRAALEARLPSALDAATLRLRAAAPPSADEIGAAVARAVAASLPATVPMQLDHELLASALRDALPDPTPPLDTALFARIVADAGTERTQRLDTVLQEVLATVTQQRDLVQRLDERLDAVATSSVPRINDNRLHAALSSFLRDAKDERTGTNG